MIPSPTLDPSNLTVNKLERLLTLCMFEIVERERTRNIKITSSDIRGELIEDITLLVENTDPLIRDLAQRVWENIPRGRSLKSSLSIDNWNEIYPRSLKRYQLTQKKTHPIKGVDINCHSPFSYSRSKTITGQTQGPEITYQKFYKDILHNYQYYQRL